MKKEDCQIRGQDSRSLLYWKRHLQKDTCGLGGEDTRSCMAWSVVQDWKSRSEKSKNKNGQSRNRNSTMPEVWEVFIPFIRTTKSTKTFKNAKKKLERPKEAAMRCKKQPNTASSRETGASTLVKATAPDNVQKKNLHSGSSWLHKATCGTRCTEKSWRSHCK